MCASTDKGRRSRFLHRLHPGRMGREGAAVVEFALVLPFLLGLLYGMVEFGRAMWAWNTLQLVADEASRWASVRPEASATAVRAATVPRGIGLREPDLRFTVAHTGPDAAGVTTVDVTVGYTFRLIVFLNGGGGTWDLEARSTMPVIVNN